MTDIPPLASPLAFVDPDSISTLFRADPAVHSQTDEDALIRELRRRADVFAAEAAVTAAAPKAARRKSPRNVAIDAALAAIADKPIDELSLDDLGPEED